MDFPAPAPTGYSGLDADQRPWKKAAIITAAIAAVELVVLVVVTLAFIAKPFATDSSATSSAAIETADVSARAQTPVLVLNGNGVAGAASQAAKTVRRLDYPVVQVTDASRKDFERTIVMYRNGSRPAAVRLARDLDLTAKRTAPLDGIRQSELMGAELVLVIGG